VDAYGGVAGGGEPPFYQRLNQILDEKKFDEYVEIICEDFYAGEVGRPGLSPGIYFRLLMVGYFEGIDSERGIAGRASDSLSIRSFVRIALDESVPDHSTISRTRRLIDLETHQAVFQWVLQVLAEKKLLKGATNRRRRNDAGSQRGTAIDCTARHRRALRRVSDAAG
jgi:transposase